LLKGNVLANKYRLLAARDFLNILKNRKLTLKAAEHENDPEWKLDELVEHLKDEVREFQDEDDFGGQMAELADIANMIDIIAMKLLDPWGRL
jgi:hypothetical protein